jgi:integrase
VFLNNRGRPYVDRRRQTGGQVGKGFRGAVKRAGLDTQFTPHTLRHSWASWFYAIHKDPILLKQTGGWASLVLVERYAHLLPAGHDDAIKKFLGLASATDLC